MADSHTKSFFGQNNGVIISSPAKDVPYIFLTSIRKKADGKWEKTSKGEGKTVKLSTEEIICILEVLNHKIASWLGYHIFKEDKTEISIGWDNDANDVLKIRIGEYTKKLKFPFTNFLNLLLSHILQEKIEFATSGMNEIKSNKKDSKESKEYGVFSEDITTINGLKAIETTKYDINTEMMEIYAKIKVESNKALLIILDTGNEVWLPKSTIHSDYMISEKETYQKFLVDKWIIEKNVINIFDKYE